MSVTDELLANNARYAESFRGPLPLPPSRHIAVLACMDARLDVYRALGPSGSPRSGRRRGPRTQAVEGVQPATRPEALEVGPPVPHRRASSISVVPVCARRETLPIRST